MPSSPRVILSTLGRHPWWVTAAAAAAVVAGLIIAVGSVVPFSSETARRKVIAVLAERFDAEVELTDLRLRLLPRFTAEGHGLTIRHHGRTDVPPFIAIRKFSASGSFFGLLRRHIARVVVDGLDIEIPPDRNRDPEAAARADKPSAPAAGKPSDKADRKGARAFVIDELISSESQVAIIPRDPEKVPKVWTIHHLRMNALSLDGPAPFVATVENGVPPGNVEVSGSFGPWMPEKGQTPLSGKFSFEHADLSVFKGISGLLSSRGTFDGSLGRIDVHGETDTPQFTIRTGHPVPLHTVYHAVVDGTNGDTLLEQVDASFLNTFLSAKGGVVKTSKGAGRTVTLNVAIDRARLEDVLRMVIKTPQPPMSGALKLTTTFFLPPGDRDVVDKLQLAGAFTIANGRFASADVQNKIDELSHRTRGKDVKQPAQSVASQFAGTFKLANGQLSLPHVTFDIPGSAVRLTGSYALVSEQLDFSGTVFTDAKVSEMTSGFKSLLLKPVDLLFNKKGGSAIPITIGGTRDKPAFGLDKGRVLKRH